MARLNQIDSLMDTNPQAAYDSLCHNKKEMMQVGGRKVEMRHQLLMAKAENKLFNPMPSDSAFQDVVDYYNRKGTANEKMEAHYLMGCIYRDQKEAPKAMQWYHSALECTDPTRQNCNNQMLSYIYGQMAEIYRCQYLHKEAIDCYLKYSHYAMKANNKADFVQGIDYIASECYALGDTSQTIKLTKRCYSLYKKYGMSQKAARVLPNLIYILLHRSQYQLARYYMDIYEKSSGLFDEKKNVISGREHYYVAKGMYYLGINKTDSAKYYYQKLSRYGFCYETAKGLLAVYTTEQNNDSIKKYSTICEQEMDKILNTTHANAVVQASALFNYSKLQKAVNEERLQKEKNKYITILVCLGTIFILIFGVKHYKKMHKRLAQINNKYIHTFKEMKKTQKELNILQNIDKKSILAASDIVKNFREMCTVKKNRTEPKTDDWKELEYAFRQFRPLLYAKIKDGKLSVQEFRVCILTYLEFNNQEMAILMNTSTNTICNAKLKTNKKMFDSSNGSALYKNLKNVL